MRKTNFPVLNSAVAGSGGKQWFQFRNVSNAAEPVEILIYEQIGKDYWTGDGIGAKDFVEQLKAIPQDREIRLRINSPGGDIADGLAIYNVLKSRRDKITARIDGLAASVSSWLPLAARSVEMPENALVMIHDPWSMAMGSAEEMRKAADSLDKHKDVIVNIYVEKTGRSKDEISQKMSEETWFTGKEAKDFGLIDVLTPADASRNLSNHDLSRFRRVPKALTENTPQHNTAVQDGGQETQMREKIIALLNKHGAKVDNTLTDEQLEAQLNAILNKTATPPPPAPAPAAATPDVTNLQSEIDRLKAQNAAERKARIQREVDACVENCQIPANSRDTWVNRVLADETVLNDLKALPVQVKPEPVIPTVFDVSASLQDIGKGIINASGIQKTSLIRKHNNRLVEALAGGYKVFNTNTIDTTLKRDVILDAMMRAFATQMLQLTAFSTRFDVNPLQGTDKFQVPFLDLETAASTNYDAEDGYVTGDTVIDNREVTIDKRKYQGLSFTSSEFRRQPFLKIMELSSLKAEKLAVDVVNDVLSLITAANFGAAAFTGAASSFDSDDVADLRQVAVDAEWPSQGRSLFLDSAYVTYLNKDGDIKTALNLGSDSVIREGAVGRLFGFDVIENTNIPANSENLVGFMSFVSAILFGSAPIEPTPDVRQQLTAYQTVSDPSGVTFEYRRWGSADFDTSKEIVEVNYGYGKGNASALKRLVSA